MFIDVRVLLHEGIRLDSNNSSKREAQPIFPTPDTAKLL